MIGIITSAPIGAWEVKLEIMTDRQTNQSTDRHEELSTNSHPKYKEGERLIN